MTKKVLIGAAVALFLGAGVFTATSLTEKEQISDLTLTNIEAMTMVDDDELIVRVPCCTSIFYMSCTFYAVSPNGKTTINTIHGYVVNC